MSVDPHGMLAHVEPDLAKVINAAAQTPQPFVVVYGIRTQAAEAQAVRTGHSTTMHSRHLPDRNGLAAAVDVAAMLDGKLSFAPGHEAEVFGKIVAQIKEAAAALRIPIECGADWHSFRDWGHVQLPWSTHP